VAAVAPEHDSEVRGLAPVHELSSNDWPEPVGKLEGNGKLEGKGELEKGGKPLEKEL